MNKLGTTRALGWLVGLLLLLSWNLQAEVNSGRIAPHYPVQSTGSVNISTPAIDDPPISLTATVGVLFSYPLPELLPYEGISRTVSVSVTGLPANGLRLTAVSPAFGIAGTPVTAEVMSLTLVNTETVGGSGRTAFRAITITVNPPLPPISLTATVGVLFASAPLPFLIPLEGTTSVNVTGLPANGLRLTSGSSAGSVIGGTPLVSGVMNLTLVNSQTPSGRTAFRAITITVNPPLPPISMTATVGVPFSFNLPFLIPLEGTTSVNVTGLPANGLSVQSGPTIGGTPLTSGVMNLTLVNSQTPSGRTAFRAITITVNPAPGTTPINNPPVAPSIASQTATVGVAYFQNTPSFTDPDGQAIAVQAYNLPPGLTYTSTASGIVAGTPTTAGVYSVSLVGTDLNDGTISGGLSATAVYTITVNPASPGGALALLAPTYNCTTGAFTFNISGGDGTPVSFSAVGITGPTTNPNQFVDQGLRTAADAPLITLSATQRGVSVTYVWNIRAVCPLTPGGGALTLLAPTYNCTTGAFTFITSGGNGTPVSFSAVGITGPTTNPNQFVDEGSRTANDVQPFLLSATQSGVTVTLLWNLKAACGRARMGVEPLAVLKVSVLGNPVAGETVDVDVTGAENQPLHIQLRTLQGQLVSGQQVKQAAAIERVRLQLNRSAGVYLLQVSSPGQTKVVRVLKVN